MTRWTRSRFAFEAIAAEMYRFPAIDPGSFRRALEDALRDAGQSPRTVG
jgi:hypothetical protein